MLGASLSPRAKTQAKAQTGSQTGSQTGVQTRAWSWARRTGVPFAASLAVHALLLALIATVAWTATATRPGWIDLGVEVGMSAPAPTPAASDPAAAGPPSGPGWSPDPPADPAPLASALPPAGAEVSLSGQSARAPAPVLGRTTAPPARGVTFAGVGAKRAATIVYAVDASGAMVTSLPLVLAELGRSIDRLTPSQRFQVVLFRDRPPRAGEAGPPARFDLFTPAGSRPGEAGLVPATPENKRAVADWLATVEPVGISNPSDGLRRALDFRPEAVFLLARSIPRSGDNPAWGAGRDAILAELDRANPFDAARGRRPAVIKTIQFLEEDPTGTMRAIGEVHGGDRGHTLLRLEDLRADGP